MLSYWLKTDKSQSRFCAITDFILNNSAAQGLKTCVIGVDGRSLMAFGVYFVVVDTTSPSTMSSTMVFTLTVLVELTPPPPPPPTLKLLMVTKRENVNVYTSELVKPNQINTHTHTLILQYHYLSSTTSYLLASPSSSLLYSAISISSRALMSSSILYSWDCLSVSARTWTICSSRLDTWAWSWDSCMEYRASVSLRVASRDPFCKIEWRYWVFISAEWNKMYICRVKMVDVQLKKQFWGTCWPGY